MGIEARGWDLWLFFLRHGAFASAENLQGRPENGKVGG